MQEIKYEHSSKKSSSIDNDEDKNEMYWLCNLVNALQTTSIPQPTMCF